MFTVLVVLSLYAGYEYLRFRRTLAEADLPEIPQNARLSYRSREAGHFGDPYTIVVLGDSTAQGVGAGSPHESFGAIVARELAMQGRAVNLINLGVSGARAKDVVTQQLPNLQRLDPDLILLSVGANDITSWVSPSRYMSDMRTLTRRLTETGAEVRVLDVPAIVAAPLLPLPARWVFDIRTKQYNEGLKDLAEEHEWALVPIYSDTRGPFEEDHSHFAADGYHPSSKGYRLWADSILDTLR